MSSLRNWAEPRAVREDSSAAATMYYILQNSHNYLRCTKKQLFAMVQAKNT